MSKISKMRRTRARISQANLDLRVAMVKVQNVLDNYDTSGIIYEACNLGEALDTYKEITERYQYEKHNKEDINIAQRILNVVTSKLRAQIKLVR